MKPPVHILGEELARNAGRRVYRARFGDQDAVTRILSPRHAEGRVAVAQSGSIRNAVLRGTTPSGVVDVAMRDTLDGYGVRAQRLGHDPRWPQALDAGVLPTGEIYITTTWVSGEPLSVCLGRLEDRERQRVIVEVAAILMVLHGCGVAHGDLKATNLVWDPARGVGVIDLDTLRYLGDAVTSVTTTDQTANWSAPEQQHGRLTYLASDVWAWAVLAERAYPQNLPARLASAISACAVLDPPQRPTAASLVTYLTSERAPLVDAYGAPVVAAPYRPGILVVAPPVVAPEATRRGTGAGVDATVRPPVGAPTAPLRNASPRSDDSLPGGSLLGPSNLFGRLEALVRTFGGTLAEGRMPMPVLGWRAGVVGALTLGVVVLALRPDEILDGKDNDWDGVIDEGTAAYDDDGDGYAEQAGDCDDASPARSPGIGELCATPGVDDNCDGQSEEAGASDGTLLFHDGDGDGYGADSTRRGVPSPRKLCAPASLHTAPREGDCYDRNADAHPDAGSFHENHRGDGSYDYDCDGTEEERETPTMKCSALGWAATRRDCYVERPGWQGSVPFCGSVGAWGADRDDCSVVGWFPPSCEPTSRQQKTQSCK